MFTYQPLYVADRFVSSVLPLSCVSSFASSLVEKNKQLQTKKLSHLGNLLEENPPFLGI